MIIIKHTIAFHLSRFTNDTDKEWFEGCLRSEGLQHLGDDTYNLIMKNILFVDFLQEPAPIEENTDIYANTVITDTDEDIPRIYEMVTYLGGIVSNMCFRY